jgi:hypothetical protein
MALTDTVSDWNSAATNPAAAWWRSKSGASTYVCSTVGIGALAALQSVLENGLRPPFVGPTGRRYTTRVRVDGDFGPGTIDGLWAYLQKIGAPASVLSVVASDARAKRIGLPTMRAALWVTYYQPRRVDIDVGNPPVKHVGTDPAILGVQPIENISIPAGAKPWVYLGRPNVPANLATLGEWFPDCMLSAADWDFAAPQVDTVPAGAAPATTPAVNNTSTGPSQAGGLPPTTTPARTPAPVAVAPPAARAPAARKGGVGAELFLLVMLIVGAVATGGK